MAIGLITVQTTGEIPRSPANQDFTIEQMRRMFTDRLICQRHLLPLVCVPTTTALAWNVSVNYLMNRGHCGGMSSTDLRFFTNPDALADFDASSTYGIGWNFPIRQHIAYYQARQFTPDMAVAYAASMLSEPANVITELQSALEGVASERPLLMINEGVLKMHVLVPYALSEDGSGARRVWLYDVNDPRERSRYDDRCRR